MDKTICKFCETKLTIMPTGCKRCLECNPLPKKPKGDKKVDSRYVDVPWTDERIWASVEDKVRNMIEELTVTKTDINDTTVDSAETVVIEQKTWREEAKELGIKTFGKKKVDVLAEIEASKLTVPVGQ